ncbi:MAG: hypothetical protein PWP24_69 [Clostridiales bacterium]|nr:hypothetical protein [Clostridiales bacterium]
MGKFTIEFYERENGDVPVEEFLLTHGKKIGAKILGIMGILKEKLELIFPERYISLIIKKR